MSPATARAPKTSAKTATAMPGGFAGQLLREDMRDQLGGIGLGSRILYHETRKGKGNVSWDHPDNRLILATDPLAGLPVWGTGGPPGVALSADLGLRGHQLSVYSIGPAGERLVRFAAIQGDYGHVASKNGVGAVMGSKRLKAVAIVKGTRALTVNDPRGLG